MLLIRHLGTIAGLAFGVLGSLYLSYDLLGKPGGVLFRVTQALTYVVMNIFLVAIVIIIVQCGSSACTVQGIIIVPARIYLYVAIGAFGAGLLNGRSPNKPPLFNRASFTGQLLWGGGWFYLFYFLPAHLTPSSPYFAGVIVFWVLLTFALAVAYAFWQRLAWFIDTHLNAGWLGAIGAGMTLFAFGIQLVLEMIFPS